MDTAYIATLGQLLLASLPDARAGLVQAVCYRAAPDFAELLRVERSYVPGQPPPSPPAGSWLGFVFAKPAITAGQIQVHVLEPTAPDGAVPNELWIKLKRAEAVQQLIDEARPRESPAAALNRLILDWARAQLPESKVRGVCESDAKVADGPAWLRTPLDVVRSGDRMIVRSPTTQTPMDAPPRFAGLYYMKVISPAWALTVLAGDGSIP